MLALLIGGVFGFLLVTNVDQRDAGRMARHSREELAAAEGLLALVVDLETGQRGFVITGEERFLEPWIAARRAFPRDARALVDIADGSGQARRARRLAEDGTSYIRDYSVPLVNAVRRKDPFARSVAATEEGKRRVDGLRATFADFTTTERATADALQNRIDDDAQRAVAVAAGGLGLSIAFVALFGGYLARAVVLPVRRAAAMAGQLAGGDLTVRMPETGAAEIGELERAFNTMGSSLEASRDELRLLAEEQAALRRVATLVAEGVSPTEVFDAVTAEMAGLLRSEAATLLRYEPDGMVALVATNDDAAAGVPVGTRLTVEGETVPAAVRRSGHASRVNFDVASDPRTAHLRELGIRTGVGAPLVVEGRLWGVMISTWKQEQVPLDIEERMSQFTELVATAIANADSRAALTASRARVVATADETRRRIERDLHDGAQQRLVHTIITLKLARQALGDEGGAVAELVDEALDHGERANAQLRELVHGILPAVLRHGGLRAGVDTLAARAPLPVSADVTADRLPPALEATAYFIVAEALTNVFKHADAGSAQVRAFVDGDALHLEVRDDGVGGARLEDSSGLLGLLDRAGAMNGELSVESPHGGGTVIAATLPIPPA